MPQTLEPPHAAAAIAHDLPPAVDEQMFPTLDADDLRQIEPLATCESSADGGDVVARRQASRARKRASAAADRVDVFTMPRPPR